MVCPITRPRTDKRLVYLPEGQWYDYHTGQRLQGGGYIIKDAPLDIIPVYIRCGSIIPKDNVRQCIDNTQDTLEINFCLGESCQYDLYLDDGLSFQFQGGKHSIVRFTMDSDGRRVSIKSKIIHNGYPIPPIRVKLYGITNHSIITLNQLHITYESLAEKEFELAKQPLSISIY